MDTVDKLELVVALCDLALVTLGAMLVFCVLQLL